MKALLSKYEGPVVVLGFVALCSAFIGWLMLPEHWKAITAYGGSWLIIGVGIWAAWPKRERS